MGVIEILEGSIIEQLPSDEKKDEVRIKYFNSDKEMTFKEHVEDYKQREKKRRKKNDTTNSKTPNNDVSNKGS